MNQLFLLIMNLVRNKTGVSTDKNLGFDLSLFQMVKNYITHAVMKEYIRKIILIQKRRRRTDPSKCAGLEFANTANYSN